MTFVEIGGEMYPMKYGHAALKRFMHKYKLKKMVQLGELPNMLEIDDMPQFIKAGFDTAAKVQQSEPPFSLAEVEELLEENLWLETASLEAFADSIQRPARKAEEAEEVAPDEAKN